MKACATWYVQLQGECPCCGEDVDYTDYDDFFTEVGDDEFVRSCKSMTVVCPECKEDFEIETYW